MINKCGCQREVSGVRKEIFFYIYFLWMIVRVGVRGRGCGKRNMSSLLIDILCLVVYVSVAEWVGMCVGIRVIECGNSEMLS